ncbi:hemerythrin HHE cation binding domain-containing protein [Stackebrandtia albiflava]|uniref:Hemerythrin HHE cation binding domain-containing protein n=1 Tax=Stackebrandtia albiflava TaxID=406432 RepID=A0A562VCZ5_9ACTN|nr:hemerythrin domain-containing protein [Stackebrandtia albiflava]TWJ15718.1 hemerythrin HHE cation binding domain-containing protein [Stackebrandtia albiflava]
MDAVKAIERDHRVLESLYNELGAGKPRQRELIAEIEARLQAHSRAEEAEVYPALAEADPSERGEVHHGVEEHREAEEKLRRAEQAIGSDGYDDAVGEFVSAISHHVEEEESDILPALKEAVSAARLRELGEAFTRRRESELSAAGIEDTGSRGDDRKGGDEDVTRQDLYRRAQKEDVHGRSDMTKDELRRALDD